jgi:L-ascorbate metabolism protein UlaG (beta-lactamase superfamily)
VPASTPRPRQGSGRPAAPSLRGSFGGRLPRPPAFGGRATGERLARIRNSPNFVDGAFRNSLPARTMRPGDATSLARASMRSADRARRVPAGPVPIHPLTPAELATPPASGLRLTWMGHASVLAEIDGARVLFDPVWGARCSPFAFVGPKRLHPVPLPLERLGPVDVVVISHDHYDHLDMPTIRALASTSTVFAVPLGVGAHLEHWGVPEERITELDWDESASLAGLTLTATPARHFCGRGLRNPQHMLWASWVVTGPEHRVFHSGDTGYFPEFTRIGTDHGPFDATMIQIGAYSEFWPKNHTDSTPLPGPWPDIHMTPCQGVQTHLDLQGGRPGGVLLPIHWATFNLAFHPWAEPGEWTLAAAKAVGQPVALPIPGQPFEPTEDIPTNLWWRDVSPPLHRDWPVPELPLTTTRDDHDLVSDS